MLTFQIIMTSDIEKRVGNLLEKSKELTHSNAYGGSSSQTHDLSLQTTGAIGNQSKAEIGASKGNFSIELRNLQNSRKVLAH